MTTVCWFMSTWPEAVLRIICFQVSLVELHIIHTDFNLLGLRLIFDLPQFCRDQPSYSITCIVKDLGFQNLIRKHLYRFLFSFLWPQFIIGVLLPLSWGIRMKIAFGAAKGLAYLHEAEKPVIYRDFKTSNILLDMVRKCTFIDHIHERFCWRIMHSDYRTTMQNSLISVLLKMDLLATSPMFLLV